MIFGEDRTPLLLHLDVFRRFLALVSYELVFDYCTLIERAQARPFHCGDMDEYIFATALRLHEAISLSRVEPLHGTGCHYTLHCSHYGLTIIRQSADTGYGSKYKKAREPPRPRHHAARVHKPLARMLPRVIDAGYPGPMSASLIGRLGSST